MRQILFACCVLVAALSARAEPVVVNGDFDTGVPRNDTGGGWTSENVDGGGGWLVSIGTPAPSFRLNDAGSVGSDPRIWQEVSGLEPGRTYTLMGEYALGHNGGDPEQSFEVRVDGDTLLELGAAAEHVNYDWIFVPFAVQFTATATSHVIEFAAECNGTDHDYAIDSIRFGEATPVSAVNMSTARRLFR